MALGFSATGALRLDEDVARTMADATAAFRRGDGRRRAERHRGPDESLRWMRAVLAQCPVGMVLVHGRPGDWAEANDRAVQMFGRPLVSLEEYRHVLRAPDGRALERDEIPSVRGLRGEHVETELLLCRDDGSSLPVHVSAAPIVGSAGETLGAVVTFQDICAAKELERLRTEWSSVVAHDLRQPLGAITLNAHAIARATEDANVLKHAERIRDAAHRLTRMVGDLMDLSRLEARRLELVRRRVDVPALVRAAVERMELEASGHPFEVRVRGEVADAWADRDRVAQVLENLLTNAVKYATTGTLIVVTVEQQSGYVAVAVSDEGKPIAPEALARAFDRFQRTDSARLQGIQGVGLGLYITRSLVEAHGGRITADCTPAGVTTFRFTLPVAQARAAR